MQSNDTLENMIPDLIPKEIKKIIFRYSKRRYYDTRDKNSS